MPILGQIWSFLGKKILFFTGEIKSFVTHITQNPPKHLVNIVFWSGIGQNVQKNGNIWPKTTKNADFGPNLAVFGPKILIFMGVSKSFGTKITENHLGNLSTLFFGPRGLDNLHYTSALWARCSHFLLLRICHGIRQRSVIEHQ